MFRARGFRDQGLRGVCWEGAGRAGYFPQRPAVSSAPEPSVRVEGLGLRVEGLGFRVEGSGFKVQGYGLGFRALAGKPLTLCCLALNLALKH